MGTIQTIFFYPYDNVYERILKKYDTILFLKNSKNIHLGTKKKITANFSISSPINKALKKKRSVFNRQQNG